jgi:hypothetical protein
MWFPPKKNLRRIADESALEKCDLKTKNLFLALKDEMIQDNAYDFYFAGTDTLLLKVESENGKMTVNLYGLKNGKVKGKFKVA